MFYQTKYFQDRINEFLSKKYKGVYSSCLKDLRNSFFPLDFEQIKQLPKIILFHDKFLLKKSRVKNSIQKLSKKNGYRVIYLVKANGIVFLDIYPKRGPKSKVSISDFELKHLISNYIKEVESQSITKIFD